MKIPSWPAWFPYPISWLRGFALFQSFIFFNNSIPVSHPYDLLILLPTIWLAPPLLFTFFHYLIATIVEAAITNLPSQMPNYDRIHQWLISKRCPGAGRHCREGWNALVILSFTWCLWSWVNKLIFTIPFVRESSISESAIAHFFLPVTAVYLYQCDLWEHQRWATKQERQSQNSTSPPPDPIKRRVKPAKQAAHEIADWYVFRSGKAEGPYTTLQLWEIQKITARTKVRRGEGDWQRAGEVSELTKYLTQQ